MQVFISILRFSANTRVLATLILLNHLKQEECWCEAIIQYDTDKDKFINVKTNREHMRIIQVNCNLAI